MKINPLLKTLLIAIPLVTLAACSHKKVLPLRIPMVWLVRA